MPQIPGVPVALEETAQILPMRLLSFYHLTQTCNLKRLPLLCLISPVSIKVLKYFYWFKYRLLPRKRWVLTTRLFHF
jgi:hypothetical protein